MKTLILRQDLNKKLRCDAFSIIRPSDGSYRAGERVEVSLVIERKGTEDEVHNYGTHLIESMEVFSLDQLGDSEARLDTGMSANETRKLMKAKYPKIEDYDYMILVKQRQTSTRIPQPQDSPSSSTHANHYTGSVQGGLSEVQPTCNGDL